MGKELVLPKNIRQIGDIQGKEKIFLEDYVMTYIKKKEKQEAEGYLGIFLGERKEKEDITYVFIRGILEVPAARTADDEEKDGHWKVRPTDDKKAERGISREAKVYEKKNDIGSEGDESNEQKQENNTAAWMDQMEKAYQEYFPDSTVQGCCVIGAYPTERMRTLLDALPEAGGLIYHLQEQEETLYQIENGRYRPIRGYFVFYEQNRTMQEYMAGVFQEDRVEKEGVSDKAIRSFRKKVKEKSIQKNTSMLKLASSFFVVTVLAVGVIVVNRIEDIRNVQSTVSLGDTTAENEILYVEDLPETAAVSKDDETADSSYKPTQAVSVNSDAADGETAQNGEVSAMTAQSVSAEGDTGNDETAKAGEVSAVTVQSVSAEGDAGNSEAAKTGEVSAVTAQSVSAESDTGNSEAAKAGAVSDMAVQNISAEANAGNDETAKTEAVSDRAVQNDLAGSDAFWDETTDTEAIQEAASMRQLQAAYVIREGDTLAEICSQYYGSLDRLAELCELNEITDANKIMPGQKIVLP